MYVPVPSSPFSFNPHTYTYPSVVNIILWSLFAVIFLTLLIPKFTGLLAVLPNELFEFTPQPQTFPSVSNAKLWVLPTAICLIIVPSGNLTWTGLSLLVVVPLPNS